MNEQAPGDPFLYEIAAAHHDVLDKVKREVTDYERDLDVRFANDLQLKDKLSAFARENQLDHALVCLWEEVKNYPAWSRRTDQSEWNKRPIWSCDTSGPTRSRGNSKSNGKWDIKEVRMENILHYVPNPENLLALEPEELAGYILEYFNALSYQERTRWLNRNSFASPFYHLQDCPPNYQRLTSEQREEIIEALMEAWFWLEHENILAPKPDANRDQFFITRRGRRLKKAADLEAHRKANLLPKDILHPSIAQKIWPAFLRGEYDPAVFLAFREVEIAVRQAGGFEPTAHGVPLMRRAFHPSQGPLRDHTNPDEGEREALASLFAGAIGSYKNPHSHRDVPLTAEDAVEMIMLANHLLRIVEARAKKIK